MTELGPLGRSFGRTCEMSRDDRGLGLMKLGTSQRWIDRVYVQESGLSFVSDDSVPIGARSSFWTFPESGFSFRPSRSVMWISVLGGCLWVTRLGEVR